MSISAATLPTGYAGSNYTSTTLTASGGSGIGFVWSASGGTGLPAGMTFSSGGVLAGKPTAAATTSFSVTVTDSASNTATTSLSLTVKAGVSISTAATLPDAYLGANYSQTLAATGGTGSGYTWTLSASSTLPDGLTLSAGGVLSGKPTAAGSSSFSVTVTDSAQNTATAPLSATIRTGLTVVTPPALPTAYVGSYYAQQLKATGGSGTYTWTMAGAAAVRSSARRMTPGGIPPGFSLSSDGGITGTPTQTGITTTTVTVTDSAGSSASTDLTFTVDVGITITTPATLPGGHPGDAFSQKLAATGGTGTGYTWTADNKTMPSGLRLSADGVLSGTLPVVNTYSLSIRVTDSTQNSANAAFALTVTDELRFTSPSTLITTYLGANFSYALHAKGGSGSGYLFTLTSGSNLPAGLELSSGGVLSSKPTSAGTFDFQITVKDSASNSATGKFSLTVNSGVTVTSPSALPAATVGTAYSQTLKATGGVGSGYIFTVSSGGSSLSAVGLTLSQGGVVSGTPKATGSAAFSVSVVDQSLNYGSANFTVTVNSAGEGFAVSGHIILGNACGSDAIPAITLTLDTNPAQTTTTGTTGNYSFASVPAGSYTITPSITGANSMFSPNSIPVTVSGATTDQNFVASLGYKVSGTVNYSGSEMGQVSIWLLNKNCGGNPLGTSIAGTGSFTIEGVPPGTYTLGAAIDWLGFGYQNDVDASGPAAADVVLSDADVTGTSITMTNPNASGLGTDGPMINAITANADGAVVNFQPIIGPHPIFKQIELADTYAVQFTEDPTFGVINQTLYFKAGGSNGTGVLILNDSHLITGHTYYFRMSGQATVQTLVHNTDWTYYSTDDAKASVIPVKIEEPAGNLVSGTVTFGATPTGPLYVGYYDMKSGALYATRIANPVSPQPYSLNVPTSTSYFHFAVLDQNRDGMIDPGDISNTRNDNATPTGISAAASGQDLTLNTPSSTATVTTQHVKTLMENGTTVETYNLSFNVREGNLLPVSLRLMSGPHIIHPVDLGKCLDCGNVQFQYNVGTSLDVPAVGDSYSLLVTYGDGTSETLTAKVTGVLGASQFVTDLSPNLTIPDLQPTFGWTYPANAGNYTYQFNLSLNGNGDIWAIPANGSNSNTFNSSEFPLGSIGWGVDPTNQANTPRALVSQTSYRWWIVTLDSNNNSAQVQTWFVAP